MHSLPLTTERLILRDFVEADWEAVLAYQKEPLYLRYYPWESRSEPEVRQFVRGFIDQQHEAPRTRWQLAVVLRGSGELIGNCGIRFNNPALREANIGYEIAPAHWGRGYATEAAREILRFGFDELGAHRVWAECLAVNTGSARVLEKLGMRREGELRQKELVQGRRQDQWIYALLEAEWRTRRG